MVVDVYEVKKIEMRNHTLVAGWSHTEKVEMTCLNCFPYEDQ